MKRTPNQEMQIQEHIDQEYTEGEIRDFLSRSFHAEQFIHLAYQKYQEARERILESSDCYACYIPDYETGNQRVWSASAENVAFQIFDSEAAFELRADRLRRRADEVQEALECLDSASQKLITDFYTGKTAGSTELRAAEKRLMVELEWLQNAEEYAEVSSESIGSHFDNVLSELGLG